MQVRFVLGNRAGPAPGDTPRPNYIVAQVREVITREPGKYRCRPARGPVQPFRGLF